MMAGLISPDITHTAKSSPILHNRGGLHDVFHSLVHSDPTDSQSALKFVCPFNYLNYFFIKKGTCGHMYG